MILYALRYHGTSRQMGCCYESLDELPLAKDTADWSIQRRFQELKRALLLGLCITIFVASIGIFSLNMLNLGRLPAILMIVWWSSVFTFGFFALWQKSPRLLSAFAVAAVVSAGLLGDRRRTMHIPPHIPPLDRATWLRVHDGTIEYSMLHQHDAGLYQLNGVRVLIVDCHAKQSTFSGCNATVMHCIASSTCLDFQVRFAPKVVLYATFHVACSYFVCPTATGGLISLPTRTG